MTFVDWGQNNETTKNRERGVNSPLSHVFMIVFRLSI